MNAYYTNNNTHTSANSDAIRKAFLSNSRKQKFVEIIRSFTSGIDSQTIWSIIFSFKIIGCIVCAISFFAVLGLIEVGSITPASGIFCAILISLLECLCFIPIGEKPKKIKK